MDALVRINKTFESFRSAIKNKKSVERLQLAKNVLHSLGCDLAAFGKADHDAFVRSLAMDAYLALLSAKSLPLSFVEKRNTLQAAFDKLKPYYLRKECLFIFLRIQNLLCYYLIQLDQLSLAQIILENMETLHDKINKRQPFDYLDAEDLFTPQPVAAIRTMSPEKIDKVMTNNIEMQAFLYNKLNLQHKYTLYSHTALRRRLESKDGSPVEWAMRAARLGQHFASLQKFASARHHLCAAYKVLRTCHDNSKLIPNEFVRQKPDFEINFLELSHYWIKYGLGIFQLSKKKILTEHFGQNPSQMDWWRGVDGGAALQVAPSVDEVKERAGEGDAADERLLRFPSLELDEWEQPVPLALVTTMDEAKRLFAFTHKWVTRARRYYDMEQYPAQHVACCLQLAELYEHLAFFEHDVDRQYGIQKCRAEVLESLNLMLKTCDHSTVAQVDVIRELSQVQLELMALNLQKLWREESRTHVDCDAESVMPSIRTESIKTVTMGTTPKSTVLRKMEAAAALTARLRRLSGQLGADPPSELSFQSLSSKYMNSTAFN